MSARFILTILSVAYCVFMNVALAEERDVTTLPKLDSVRQLVQSHCVESMAAKKRSPE